MKQEQDPVFELHFAFVKHRPKAARRDNLAGRTFLVSCIALDNPIARDHFKTFVTHAGGGDDIMVYEEEELLAQGSQYQDKSSNRYRRASLHPPCQRCNDEIQNYML